MGAEEASAIDSILSLLLIIETRTTGNILSPFAPGHARWERYLKLLARGLGSNAYNSRSISELWPSQLEALKKGLLDDSSSKIIKMPTTISDCLNKVF